MTVFHYYIHSPEETIETLLRDKWMASKKTVHELRMTQRVVDETGQPLDWKFPLTIGKQLTFQFPETTSNYRPEPHSQVRVIYEDDHYIVAFKPSGIATHPEHVDGTGTFMNAMMAYAVDKGFSYVEHVHRLDKGTAGLILVAKHPIAKTIGDRLLEANEIDRIYVAEVQGMVKKPRGTLRFPIGKDRHHPSRRRVSANGQNAITHFKVIKRLESSTLVEVRLQTGRTHQIRVHFTHIGHPIIGDTVYGGPATNDGTYRLRATRLSFFHPFLHQQITIEDSYR